MPPNKDWADTVYWIYSILVDEKKTDIKRDELCARLTSEGIENRPFFFPLHIQPPYFQDNEFFEAERISSQGISLPSGNEITDESIDRVCDVIKSIFLKKDK